MFGENVLSWEAAEYEFEKKSPDWFWALGILAADDGVGGVLPVALFIPGCPPHPLTLLYAILGFLGRSPEKINSRSIEQRPGA